MLFAKLDLAIEELMISYLQYRRGHTLGVDLFQGEIVSREDL